MQKFLVICKTIGQQYETKAVGNFVQVVAASGNLTLSDDKGNRWAAAQLWSGKVKDFNNLYIASDAANDQVTVNVGNLDPKTSIQEWGLFPAQLSIVANFPQPDLIGMQDPNGFTRPVQSWDGRNLDVTFTAIQQSHTIDHTNPLDELTMAINDMKAVCFEVLNLAGGDALFAFGYVNSHLSTANQKLLNVYNLQDYSEVIGGQITANGIYFCYVEGLDGFFVHGAGSLTQDVTINAESTIHDPKHQLPVSTTELTCPNGGTALVQSPMITKPDWATGAIIYQVKKTAGGYPVNFALSIQNFAPDGSGSLASIVYAPAIAYNTQCHIRAGILPDTATVVNGPIEGFSFSINLNPSTKFKVGIQPAADPGSDQVFDFSIEWTK